MATPVAAATCNCIGTIKGKRALVARAPFRRGSEGSFKGYLQWLKVPGTWRDSAGCTFEAGRCSMKRLERHVSLPPFRATIPSLSTYKLAH